MTEDSGARDRLRLEPLPAATTSSTTSCRRARRRTPRSARRGATGSSASTASVTLIDAGPPLPFINRAIARTADRRRPDRPRSRSSPFYDVGPRHAVPARQRMADARPRRRIGFTLARPSAAHAPAARTPFPAAAARAADRARRRRPHRVRLRARADLRLPRAATATDARGHDRHTGRTRPRRVGITSSVTSTTSRWPSGSGSSAIVWCASTTSQRSNRHRGRGYGLALTARGRARRPDEARHADRERPRSARVYERLGFVALLRFTYWLGCVPEYGPTAQTPKLGGVHDRDRRSGHRRG